MMDRTLITGARGTLGRDFALRWPDALTPTSVELDVRDAAAVDDFVRVNGVTRIIHCAARTAVRYCEENKRDTFLTNVGGTVNLCAALAAHAADPHLVYISTACVFPGDDPQAVYAEDDIPHPKNYYALTKLLAENHIEAWTRYTSGASALIVRTNFAERGPWRHPNAFSDRFGTYLFPDLVAGKVSELAEAGETGVVHVCGDRKLSMLEFARLSDPGVGEVTLDQYSGPPVTVNMSLRSIRIAPLTLA